MKIRAIASAASALEALGAAVIFWRADVFTFTFWANLQRLSR
jgi:hypothetical protein